MTTVSVTLPYGFEAEGGWHRRAILRPLLGEDEDFLRTVGDDLLPAERLTALLARCLVTLGPWQAVTLDQVCDLTVGDRDALALHLQRLTFGDRLDCILTCPTCGERMDLELSASALTLEPYGQEERTCEAVISQGNEHRTFKLRSPTGRDVEEAAHIAVHDPARALSHLLHKCVSDADGKPPTDRSAELEAELAERLAQLDPQADLLIDVACPNCQAAFQVSFDPAGFLFQELSAQADVLYREVHLLALNYHWSEQEILRLPAKKRRMYLELIADSLAPME